ncbi:MAG: DUF2141 domain-containing protein [Hyphomicrobiales bacterium]
MRWIGLQFSLALGLTVAITAADAQAANKVAVSVTGIRNDNGVVRCGLYSKAEGFPKPGQESRGVVARISGQQATCLFDDLKPGTYAVAAFHAEQNETQMQYGLFGKPKEGYGFSGNPPSSTGAPAFSAAAFDYKGGTQTVPLRLQY